MGVIVVTTHHGFAFSFAVEIRALEIRREEMGWEGGVSSTDIMQRDMCASNAGIVI